MCNEKAYLDLARDVLKTGRDKCDRTGTGAKSLFGRQMRFDLRKGFPLITTKRVPFKLIATELLWFLKGDTNIRYLLENGNNIWNEWAFKEWVESSEYDGPDMSDFGNRSLVDEEFKKEYDIQVTAFKESILNDDAFAERFGDLGPVYGKQWRFWETVSGETIDQIDNVITSIKSNPDSRRHIVTAWNPGEVENMALPPCHTMFQFDVTDGRLSCQLYQRSADLFLGVPFNIASYALLTHLIAHECDLEVGDFVHTLGNVHIYSNHVNQVSEQLNRNVREAPVLNMLTKEKKGLQNYTLEDFEIVGYEPHPAIRAPIAV